MEILGNETPLDVLSRAACMLGYTSRMEKHSRAAADKGSSAVKRSFADLEIEDRLPHPPPCLPPSVHYHPCRPRPTSSPVVGDHVITMRSSKLGDVISKCPRLDGFHGNMSSGSSSSSSSSDSSTSTSSVDMSSGGGMRYPSVAEADTTRKCAATQTFYSSFNYSPSDSLTTVPRRLLPPPYSSSPFADNRHTMTSSRHVLDLDRNVGLTSSFLTSTANSFQSSAIVDDRSASNVPLNLTKRSTAIADPTSDVTCDVLRTTPAGGRVAGRVVEASSRTQRLQHVGAPSDSPPLVGKLETTHLSSSSSSSSLPPWYLEERVTLAADVGSRRTTASLVDGTRRPDSSPCLRRETRNCVSAMNVGCEREIEEHFQRSLGRHYPSVNQPRHSPTNNDQQSSLHSFELHRADSSCDVIVDSPPPVVRKMVDISITVDDHFAKSLGGATWNRIKETIDLAPDGNATAAASGSTSDNSGVSDRDLHITPGHGSVDDHFAKALGAEWFKIKAGSHL